MLHVMHIRITWWGRKGERPKHHPPPEHLRVTIRDPDTSPLGDSVGSAPGSGQVGTGVTWLNQRFSRPAEASFEGFCPRATATVWSLCCYGQC